MERILIKAVKELLETADIWIDVNMKDYHDSRAVPDELVALCARLGDVRHILDKKEVK